MNDDRSKRPLLLRGRLRPLDPSLPNGGTRYDDARQLWLDAGGEPVHRAKLIRASSVLLALSSLVLSGAAFAIVS